MPLTRIRSRGWTTAVVILLLVVIHHVDAFRLAANNAVAGESLFRAADESLYAAKSGGRNHVSLGVL